MTSSHSSPAAAKEPPPAESGGGDSPARFGGTRGGFGIEMADDFAVVVADAVLHGGCDCLGLGLGLGSGSGSGSGDGSGDSGDSFEDPESETLGDGGFWLILPVPDFLVFLLKL